MISCYELRIGNNVLVDENLRQVSMINNTTASTIDLEEGNGQGASEQSLENIDPVPISDEILKQCGFVYNNHFKIWQLITGTQTTRSEMDIDRDYSIIDLARRPIIRKLTSLHQLQNCYFILKGKELAFAAAVVVA